MSWRLPPVGRGRRVVLGFSGGVDSALAAHALKASGYDVVAVYMRNWEEKEEGFCTADQDEKEARQLADSMRIEFARVDFTREYWVKVFHEYLMHSADGLASPNPDVLVRTCYVGKCFNKLSAHFYDLILLSAARISATAR